MNPTKTALDIPSVKYAHFTRSQNSTWRGIVAEEITGSELSVRQIGLRWNVNDDYGRNFRSFSLKHAIYKAIRANTEES